MTQPQTPPEIDALTAELRILGNELIKPETVPPDWPEDFFDPVMNYGTTTHMTQAQKSAEYRRRALYATLRASAYEKALASAKRRTRAARFWCFTFAIVWGLGVFAVNHQQIGAVKNAVGAVSAVVPGLGALTQQQPIQ